MINIKEILQMDVKSDEFFEVYKAVSDKYWTFEEPDSLQIAAKNLVMFAEKYDADKIILAHKLIVELLKMDQEKTKSASMHLVFENMEYYIDISENEIEKDKLKGSLSGFHQAMREGKVTDKFGKRFF